MAHGKEIKMGTSTNGQICYGVIIDGNSDGPWDDESLPDDVEGDIKGWWGWNFGEAETYVELVNYCSNEYPMYIIAIDSSCTNARRGYPKEFNPQDLTISDEDRILLIEFCKELGIKFSGGPAWYLSSYWG
jgi:hypothetical protein